MKIRELISESPLDSTGTAVGRGVGKGAYGAGYAAGKIASKFGSSKDSTSSPKDNTAGKFTDKDSSAGVLKSLWRGLKSGTYKYGTGQSLMKDYDLNDDGQLVDRIIKGKDVNKEELNQLVNQLSSIKVSWKTDINAVKTALTKAQKAQPLDGTDINALKIFRSDLKKT